MRDGEDNPELITIDTDGITHRTTKGLIRGTSDDYAENILVKYNNSVLNSYTKKIVSNVYVKYFGMTLPYYSSSPFVGGTIEALDSTFYDSVNWDTVSNSQIISLNYVYINNYYAEDQYIIFPYYHIGHVGYNGTAIRDLYSQLPIGFRFGNNARVADKENVHYRLNPPEFIFEFSDWNPTLLARFPISGAFVNPSADNMFSVSFSEFDSIDYPTAQTITYELKDVATSAVTSHNASVSINLKDRTYIEWTVPAGTLTSGKNYQFRAKIITDDGETSFSGWADFTTIDATPGIPTIIYPQSKYLVGEEPITLQWQHNVTTGSTQYAYDLQYQQASGWTNIVSHGVSSAQSYTLAASFFVAGTMYWRVRTYNTDDVAGDWGTSSANVIQAKPVTPILYGVTSSPRISINWQSVGQQAYRVIITDSAGAEVYNSYDTYGTIQSLTIDDYLPDGNYVIKLQIENGLGIWSDPAYQSIKVSNSSQPGDDILTATPVSGGVRLSISIPEPTGASYVGDDVYVGEVYAAHQPYNASGTRYILRDGEPIAEISGTAYTDYTCSGLHEYVCRIVLDGNYHDTNAAQASPLIRYACISKFDSPDNVFVLKFNEGSRPTKEKQLSKVYNSSYYAGRALPVHDVTEHYSSTWNFGYSFIKKSDYDELEQLFLDGDTVMYRDNTGFKAVGTLTGIRPSPKVYGTIPFTFTIEETDTSEVIDYA